VEQLHTAEPVSAPGEPGLAVWRAGLRRPPEWIAAAASSVLRPEESSARPGEREDVRRRRLVSRTVLRLALGLRLGCDPQDIRFAAEPDGKPRLAGERSPALHFNLSHGGETCVVAISDLGPVGVDIEEVRPRTHLERLVETRLAPAEADGIMRLDPEERPGAFYRVWTRKEAYLKARGLGLAARLDTFAVSAGARAARLAPLPGDDQEWSLYDLALGDALCGALALEGSHRARASITPTEMPIELPSRWRPAQ
jgi:4'-phosphopantetheinyl transferase